MGSPCKKDRQGGDHEARCVATDPGIPIARNDATQRALASPEDARQTLKTGFRPRNALQLAMVLHILQRFACPGLTSGHDLALAARSNCRSSGSLQAATVLAAAIQAAAVEAAAVAAAALDATARRVSFASS
jgi:hypothetical protein